MILYWNGFSANAVGQDPTDTIDVSGNVVVGTRIGGPDELGFDMNFSSTYRADITSLALVGNGMNSLAISGLDFDINNGAGLLVIVDDGINTTNIQLKDGDDWTFEGFGLFTVPVTYNFAPAGTDRVGDLAMFFGSVSFQRPTVIEIRIDGLLVESLYDQLDTSDGPEWDTFLHSIRIPAGASSLTVQAISHDSGLGAFAGAIPASFVWMASAFTLAPEEMVCTGSIGDFVWNDLNMDGIQDAGEPGIAGVLVTLTDDMGMVLDMDVTDASGLYLFADLCAGEYKVEVDGSTLPAGFVASPCEQGMDPALDSNCMPACVTLTSDMDEDLTIDFGYFEQVALQGCTPGYWGRPQHFDSYPAPYTATTLFSAVFEDAFPGETLAQVAARTGRAIRGGDGGMTALEQLGRHTVAALLNAQSPDVNYGLTTMEVIDAFNAVFPGTDDDYRSLKDMFAFFNEIGCPLN